MWSKLVKINKAVKSIHRQPGSLWSPLDVTSDDSYAAPVKLNRIVPMYKWLSFHHTFTSALYTSPANLKIKFYTKPEVYYEKGHVCEPHVASKRYFIM